ncbi:16006_t:CDS:2, partial [Gigaspora rosea]
MPSREGPKNHSSVGEEIYTRVRVNKGLSCKGRKAKWYTILEKEILKEMVNREVKEEFVTGLVNKLAMKKKKSTYRALGTGIAGSSSRDGSKK